MYVQRWHRDLIPTPGGSVCPQCRGSQQGDCSPSSWWSHRLMSTEEQQPSFPAFDVFLPGHLSISSQKSKGASLTLCCVSLCLTCRGHDDQFLQNLIVDRDCETGRNAGEVKLNSNDTGLFSKSLVLKDALKGSFYETFIFGSVSYCIAWYRIVFGAYFLLSSGNEDDSMLLFFKGRRKNVRMITITKLL